jgi:hypothetical protein
VSQFELGCYVSHSKLPDLGAGEVLGSEKGTIRIRFASGDRNFLLDLVAPHLVITAAAPAVPASAKPARARKSRKKAAG